MAFELESEIKRLVKDPINPTDLADAIKAGENAIQAVTGIPDNNVWTTADPAYGILTTIGANYGAFTVLFGWNKEMYLDKAKLILQAYNDAVKTFKEMPIPEDKTDPLLEDQIVSSEYGIPQLNKDAPRFLSDY